MSAEGSESTSSTSSSSIQLDPLPDADNKSDSTKKKKKRSNMKEKPEKTIEDFPWGTFPAYWSALCSQPGGNSPVKKSCLWNSDDEHEEDRKLECYKESWDSNNSD